MKLVSQYRQILLDQREKTVQLSTLVLYADFSGKAISKLMPINDTRAMVFQVMFFKELS